MKKFCFLCLVLGLILSACDQKESGIGILDEPPNIMVEDITSTQEINQVTGVVCWDNCLNKDRSFGFKDIDDDTLQSLTVNPMKEDTVFRITHEGPQAGEYGYFAQIDQGDHRAGYNISIESNEFPAYPDEGTYLVAAQWFDKDELVGYVYSLYRVVAE
jgi:hypothetical protein